MSPQDLDVNLFISTQCPHCAQTLDLLTTAVKQGIISQLNITNLSSPNTVENYPHIRSVPFIQIQDFELTGAITQAEIDAWGKSESSFSNYYFTQLLSDGQLSKVELLIKKNPAYWLELINIAKDNQTKMQVRIGINVIFETLTNELLKTDELNTIVSALISASDTENQAVRVDLIYFISLLYSTSKRQKQTNNKLFIFIESLANDPSDEVKEIINDVLGTPL